jgi:UDP-N-acetylglucosamine 4,6-dehydratase
MLDAKLLIKKFMNLTYNTCLITGGTGSFGLAYAVNAISKQWHKKIILFSRDEFKQVKAFGFLSSYFSKKNATINHSQYPYSLNISGVEIRFIIGDVYDFDKLLNATKNVDLVIHAAALKHVDICEYNTISATQINIDGTRNVVCACGENNVTKLIALSTDKAVDPINLYGATKLCLEKIVLGGNHIYPKTSMNVVRYGNIIGSRGSFIHKILTEDPKSLSITNPDMTRFWFTIEGAVKLVRTALELSYDPSRQSSKLIFVPKLKSLDVGNLCSYLCPDSKINISQIRPGEKIHECMISNTEADFVFEHKNKEHYILNFSINSADNFENNLYSKTSLKGYTSDNVDIFTKEDFLKNVNNTLMLDILGVKS